VATAAETFVLEYTVVNLAGTSGRLTLQTEGSYDGQVWKDVGPTLSTTAAPSSAASAATATDYAFLRVRAVVSSSGDEGGDADVLFDAVLVFTHQ
jgi:hypothetical protein